MPKQESTINEVGKRKTAIARVFVRPRSGEAGKIRVNRRAFEEYFTVPGHRQRVLQPLELTQTVGQFDIQVNVNGGGISAQAGAVRHGIAKALLEVDVTYRAGLKKAGLLTRDSREVERKKYGMAGARKRFQFSKR